MRKFIMLLLALMLMAAPAVADDISVFVDGQKVDFGEVQPEIVEGRTLVPLRATFEALDAVVDWYGSEQRIDANRGNISLELIIGQKSALRNSLEIGLEVPAQVKNGRTLVPLRFVSEALGDDVVWEGATSTIKITSASPPQSGSDKELQVHFIDVGQGDAILVLSPNGSTMLIDAGPRTAGQKIVSYLKAAGITTIDKLVATHPHEDHIGGMQDVFTNFEVKKVYDSGFPHTTKIYESFLTTIDEKEMPYEIAHRGNQINLDSELEIDILHPGETMSDINNNSIVLRMTYDTVSFIFTGDAEAEAEHMILDYSTNIPSQILKIGHHGSRTSTSEEFLSAANPEIAVIMVGTGNTYGHPHQETLNKLANTDVKVARTDLEGDIVVKSNGGTYSLNVVPTAETPTHYDQPSYTVPVQSGKININTASFEDLQEIIHIGAERAQEVINLRPFISLDELSKVTGIGPARLADIKAEGKAYVE
ncbi:MAG: hypothetical protein APF76_04660 [Desulfitibacter sp. BRH_c19]|nr:MAG: hypothetical protein APF76_04660 [Desulfitibacter sp. BRH_c19]